MLFRVKRYYIYVVKQINQPTMKSIFTLFAVAFLSLSAFAEVSSNQKQALIDLYNATNGSEWNTTWNLDADVSTWHGVRVINNNVVGLNLSMNNLNGHLPESLGDLDALVTLELFFNKIQGELPSSIGNLKNLKVLVLNGNMLDGKLPESIYNLTKLEQLMLTSNNLSGSISNDVSKLENLEVLNLFDNNLNGNLPLAVLKLENLKELNLSNNQLAGVVPVELKNMKNLKTLALAANNFDNYNEGVAFKEDTNATSTLASNE